MCPRAAGSASRCGAPKPAFGGAQIAHPRLVLPYSLVLGLASAAGSLALAARPRRQLCPRHRAPPALLAAPKRLGANRDASLVRPGANIDGSTMLACAGGKLPAAPDRTRVASIRQRTGPAGRPIWPRRGRHPRHGRSARGRRGSKSRANPDLQVTDCLKILQCPGGQHRGAPAGNACHEMNVIWRQPGLLSDGIGDGAGGT